MPGLVLYELSKVWQKKSFLLSVNLFLLWYVNLPDEGTPPLAAYKSFQEDVNDMTEEEKIVYITELKNQIDGVFFVRQIQTLQNMGNEMGVVLAEQELNENPGVYETYYELYQSGNYLLYTNDLAQESTLVDMLYEEACKVFAYEDYLKNIQEAKDTLKGISIFKNENSDTFSERNIEKSAADYEELDHVQIKWQSSKGITLALENPITSILLFLGMMLFVCGLITEEKEKRLFYITRATKHGIWGFLSGKLGALMVHAWAVTVVMTGANMVFSAITTGTLDLTASLQSLAPYMESSLSVSILEYLLLSVITRAVGLFAFGLGLTAVAVGCSKSFMPYFAGIVMLAVSGLCYVGIPAYSNLSPLRYLNFIGAMETEDLYGGYLNFNINGQPVSRTSITWFVLTVFIMIAVVLCMVVFRHGRHLEITRIRIPQLMRFRPHDNLFRHEAYKIFIINRAALILPVFAFLIGYYGLSQEYHPSANEEYYQQMMLQLEGEFTSDKEQIILSEKARFEEASDTIEQINRLVQEGELGTDTADAMKMEWEAVLSFYTSFERIEAQYNRVKQYGGEMIYDTGWLYLFGKQDNSFLLCAIMLSLGVILSFHNSISKEYGKNSWFLLNATLCGRRKIIVYKVWICLMGAGLLSLIPWIFRSISISSVFPMQGLDNPIQSIPAFADIGIKMSVISFTILAILMQMVSVMITSALAVAISGWRKNDIQSLFFCLLILVIPMALRLLGFDFAGWFSIYSIYSWTGL